jgi:soluble lytic murein transglycosylase-like protein
MIPSKYDDMIEDAVKQRFPVLGDWRYWKAQLFAESSMDPHVESDAGALGLAQFMEDTWAEWSPRAGFAGAKRTDPEASIYTGATYMQWLWSEWRSPRPVIDRFCLAAASYNSGLGDVLDAQTKMGGVLGYAQIVKGLPIVDPKGAKETVKYVRKILYYYSDIVIGLA